MSLYKYKTFEEAEKALWNFHPDENYFKEVEELWEFANELSPIKYPSGIFKFHNIEEANKHRDQIEFEYAVCCNVEIEVFVSFDIQVQIAIIQCQCIGL